MKEILKHMVDGSFIGCEDVADELGMGVAEVENRAKELLKGSDEYLIDYSLRDDITHREMWITKAGLETLLLDLELHPHTPA